MNKRKKSGNLFKEINVWRSLDDSKIVKYRCFQVLPDKCYFVKSSQFYYPPLVEKHIDEAEFYFIDSLFDGGIKHSAKKTYKTLEKAIAEHDKNFEDFSEENKV